MTHRSLLSVAIAAALAAAAAPALAAPDWSKAPARKMTLFYPGTASLEWTLKGTEHSGGKALREGETCASCHEQDAADVGQKIVSGGKKELEKAAVKVPGSIPVTVQATHDATHLYVRMQWKDTKSAAVHKLDARNTVKAAMMIVGENVEYAKVGGCWATCHHDLRSMPDVAKNAAQHPKAKALDVQADGPTKFIKESRTSITNKEHPWGGWDKLKPDADVAAAFKAGQFYDLVQFRSAEVARDGHVLEARRLKDAPGSAEGKLEGDTWTVVFTRKLAGGDGDHALAPGKTYYVGFAIHDAHSAARYHHVSLGYSLALDGKADISANKQ